MRHERYAADVYVTVFLGESQPLREVLAHDVAVEDLYRYSRFEERLLNLVCNRRLARARQAGEPDDRASIPIRLFHLALPLYSRCFTSSARLCRAPREPGRSRTGPGSWSARPRGADPPCGPSTGRGHCP